MKRIKSKSNFKFASLSLECQHANNSHAFRFNTQIKNSPIFNSAETAFIASIPILSAILFRVIHLLDQSDFGAYRAYMIVEVLQEYLFGIGIPIMVYGRKKQMRKFLWRELKDMFIKDDARSNAKTKPKVLCIMFLISTYLHYFKKLMNQNNFIMLSLVTTSFMIPGL